MDYATYIKPELLVLIPVLVFIGWGLKNAKGFKDEAIPITLGLVGILLSAFWIIGTGDEPINYAMACFNSIIQGILCAGAAVFSNQIWKQNIASNNHAERE